MSLSTVGKSLQGHKPLTGKIMSKPNLTHVRSNEAEKEVVPLFKEIVIYFIS